MFSKSHSLNVLRNVTNSVAFYCKLATFINFLKNGIFFVEKTHPFFWRKTPKFWTFWEFLRFQWPCSATLLLLAVFWKKVTSISKNPSIFLIKKSKFLKFWEVLIIQLHLTVNLLPLTTFQKNHNFFSKNTFVWVIKTNFWTLWEVLLFQLHPPKKIFNFGDFYKIIFFSKNPYNLFNITNF